MSFDRVAIVSTDGVRRNYSVHEFLEMPLNQRVGYILGRSLEFFLGAQPIDRADALKSLRSWRG